MEKQSALMEDAGNMKWQQLLKVFGKIIDGNPKPEKVKESFDKLKEQVKSSALLSFRQVEGIIARCDNYMKGQYGNTKTEANLSHGAIPVTK